MLAGGASTALSSLAATAGGGEAALCPGSALRTLLAEVFDVGGGGRWANRGTGAHLLLAPALLHLLKLCLNSIDASCIWDSENNLKKHKSTKRHQGLLVSGAQVMFFSCVPRKGLFITYSEEKTRKALRKNALVPLLGLVNSSLIFSWIFSRTRFRCIFSKTTFLDSFILSGLVQGKLGPNWKIRPRKLGP